MPRKSNMASMGYSKSRSEQEFDATEDDDVLFDALLQEELMSTIHQQGRTKGAYSPEDDYFS